MLLECPICGRKLDVAEDFKTRPFCSARCKKVDLHNWLNAAYRISEPLEFGEAEAELPRDDSGTDAPADRQHQPN